VERDTVEEGAEGHDDQYKRYKTRECAKPGWTPAANGGDREHDGKCFHGLDQRG
jgi:hypothetical protein